MVLLLLIHCIVLLLWFVGVIICVWALFYYAVQQGERAGCFTLVVFLVDCDCSCYADLPRGAVDWSALCDCGIS